MPDLAAHGTTTCYHNGCSCDLCKAANREAMRRYRARRRPPKCVRGLGWPADRNDFTPDQAAS